MRNVVSLCILLVVWSAPAWGIDEPSFKRADPETQVLACQQAQFAQGDQVVQAMKSRRPSEALRVLGGALRELRNTPETAPLYSARAFCIHELVPNQMRGAGRIASQLSRRPTWVITDFEQLGIEYFYYDPSAEWTLRKDPVNLRELAEKHLDSRWGREAFLMMTKIGWSQGDCVEGTDQFREVIKRGEAFLKRYPQSEVSAAIRLELANAYATWWNLSRQEADLQAEPPFSPEPYQPGAEAAKERAIQLYRQFQAVPRPPSITLSDRLQKLREDPKGSKTYDYYCNEDE